MRRVLAGIAFIAALTTVAAQVPEGPESEKGPEGGNGPRTDSIGGTLEWIGPQEEKASLPAELGLVQGLGPWRGPVEWDCRDTEQVRESVCTTGAEKVYAYTMSFGFLPDQREDAYPFGVPVWFYLTLWQVLPLAPPIPVGNQAPDAGPKPIESPGETPGGTPGPEMGINSLNTGDYFWQGKLSNQVASDEIIFFNQRLTLEVGEGEEEELQRAKNSLLQKARSRLRSYFICLRTGGELCESSTSP